MPAAVPALESEAFHSFMCTQANKLRAFLNNFLDVEEAAQKQNENKADEAFARRREMFAKIMATEREIFKDGAARCYRGLPLPLSPSLYLWCLLSLTGKILSSGLHRKRQSL